MRMRVPHALLGLDIELSRTDSKTRINHFGAPFHTPKEPDSWLLDNEKPTFGFGVPLSPFAAPCVMRIVVASPPPHPAMSNLHFTLALIVIVVVQMGVLEFFDRTTAGGLPF